MCFIVFVNLKKRQTSILTRNVQTIFYFTFLFSALHFIIMVVWITKLKPEFGKGSCQQGLFTVGAAIIHLFCFLNLKDGKSRYRMIFYYILMLVETAVFMTTWYWCKIYTGPIWFDVTAFSVVFGSFLFGKILIF